MTDRVDKMLHDYNVSLDEGFSTNMEKVTVETKKTLEELERIKGNASERFTSYYNRKKGIDYLIFTYMAVSPMLFGIIIWLLVSK